ncbi:hypothetical protein [Pseudoalteromonas sp. S4741]|uniref:hypothetical protein n=1 Tax=Pseudoalteromonas sp. S4741 TaxID=579563 RepID=UPI00110BE70C|nr:hypothetical protein [Pseudoalteromonas sp. S4741]TMO22077.1 hypothetical protein CWC30_12335 [Pseudoalteromonas sp. S4741]
MNREHKSDKSKCNLIHIVCVTYCSGSDISQLEQRIKKLFKSHLAIIESVNVINTAKKLCMPSGNFISQSKLNSLFEFSGYYYGLELIKFKYGRNATICFINDTIFTSHISSYYKMQLFDFINNEYDHSLPFIYGDFQQKFHGKIVPTCFFIVNIREDYDFFLFDKSKFTETNGSFIPKRPIEKLYVGEERLFDEHINNWLYPTGLLKGWYKASPNKPLPLQTYKRKRLAIFLEHSLLKNNIEFESHVTSSIWVSIYRFLDVNYQRVLKASSRIRSLFSDR